LIAAAHAVELAPLREALGGEAGPRAGLRVTTHAVGVGLAAAGGGAARALALHACRGVVLVGSYGAYPGSSARIASLLAPTETRLIDEALLSGRAAAPSAMPARARTDGALRAGLIAVVPEALDGVLATTAFITTDDALAAALGGSGCVGENLEAVAVGLACETAAVPWAALLACTNDVGARGRAQWLAEHTRAAALTSTALLRWLDRGAPGLA
jgi:futalosine hydrolase